MRILLSSELDQVSGGHHHHHHHHHSFFHRLFGGRLGSITIDGNYIPVHRHGKAKLSLF